MRLKALRELARAGARALARQGHRRHRLGRQDHHQGGAAACAVGGRRNARIGCLLQQSLGRAAVAGALSGLGEVRRVRDRHEPCRRDHAAGETRAAACRHHHHDRAGASGIFRHARKDRRRQGGNLRRRRAGRRGRAQPRQCAVRAACGRGPARPASRASSRSANTAADARLLRISLQADASTVEANILGAAGDLQARRAGPPYCAQFARRAGGGVARRRRPRARRAGARQSQAAESAAARAARSRCRAAPRC